MNLIHLTFLNNREESISSYHLEWLMRTYSCDIFFPTESCSPHQYIYMTISEDNSNWIFGLIISLSSWWNWPSNKLPNIFTIRTPVILNVCLKQKQNNNYLPLPLPLWCLFQTLIPIPVWYYLGLIFLDLDFLIWKIRGLDGLWRYLPVLNLWPYKYNQLLCHNPFLLKDFST